MKYKQLQAAIGCTLQPGYNGSRMLRTSILVFLSTFTFAGARILDFDISPAGKDDAVGLSPTNEVPPVTGTGSGNAISGGITFNTDTSTLSYAMGYGSAAGFTDLTGAATGVHIHGPAAAGAEASVLFDLATSHFPAVNPTKGGVIFGSVVLTPTQATNLLNGQNYVNIHTTANSEGEIRGQLIRANSDPVITGLQDRTVECGKLITYSATISDFDGDAVSAVWSVNGVDVETENIAATGSPSNVEANFKAELDHGVNLLTLTATDSEGNKTIVDAIITVEDTIAPEIISASASPSDLWPPNHKFVTVVVDARVKDACGKTTWKIIKVRSSQPVTGKGDNTNPDFKIVDDHVVKLRAERRGKVEGGRVYSIIIQAKDEAGNKSERKTVKVTVPHDQGN